MITEKQFRDSADNLNTTVAVIKAVAEVESGGKGFLSTGEPVILFEPHIFWRELIANGKDPNRYTNGNMDILYPKWKSSGYGPSTIQHARLQRAIKIDREAALCSASWGRFQIMGFNYKLAGFDDIQDFVNAMYKDEDEHLKAFVNFVKSKKLDIHLRRHNWARFAEGYNGKSYKLNMYDIKLERAYKKYKQ